MAGPALLVHDDIATIAAAKRALSKHGIDTLLVTNAADAVVTFGDLLPDVVVLAPAVDGGQGGSVYEEIRNHPQGQSTRFVFLGQGVSGAAGQVVSLPFDVELLVDAVKVALSGEPPPSEPKAEATEDLFGDLNVDFGLSADGPLSGSGALQTTSTYSGALSNDTTDKLADELFGDLTSEVASDSPAPAEEAPPPAFELPDELGVELALDVPPLVPKEEEPEHAAPRPRPVPLPSPELAPLEMAEPEPAPAPAKPVSWFNDDPLPDAQPVALPEAEEPVDELPSPFEAAPSSPEAAREPPSSPEPPLPPKATMGEEIPAPRVDKKAEQKLEEKEEEDQEVEVEIEEQEEEERPAAPPARRPKIAPEDPDRREDRARVEYGDRRRVEQEIRLRVEEELVRREREAPKPASSKAKRKSAPRHEPKAELPEIEGKDARRSLLPARDDAPPSPTPPPFEAEGTLALLDAPHLFAQVYRHRVTGRFDFDCGEVKRSLWFEAGRLVGASSSATAERIEDIARRDGLVSRAQHRALRAASIPVARRIALQMAEMGFIKPAEMYPLVRRRVEEITFALFADEEGDYLYLPEVADPEERIVLPEHPLALMAEGVRRRFSLERLFERLGGPTTLLRPRERGAIAELNDFGFSARERRLAGMVDGLHTLEELLFEGGLDQLATLKVLYGLVCAEVVQIVALGIAPSTARPEEEAAIDLNRIGEKYEQVRSGDYFEMLGVRRDASSYEVREAYERLSRELDPARFREVDDRQVHAQLEEIGRMLAEACDVLADDRVRADYARNLVD